MGHELGHLILHRYVDFDEINDDKMQKIEREANLFSSHFLLPEEELRNDFTTMKDKTNFRSYIPLKKKYKMSIQSIAYRANKEGWMTKEENRTSWRKLNQAGYRTFEPLDDKLTIHIPGKIRALIHHATKQDPHFINNWLNKYSVDIEYFEYIFHIKDDSLRKLLIKNPNSQSSNDIVNIFNR